MRAIPRRRRRLLLPRRRNWSRPTPLPSRYTNVFDWKSFVFSVFLDQNRSFFLCLSLSGEIVSLSLSSSRKYTTVGREKSDERRDFLSRQHKRFFVRMLLCFSAKREGKYYSEKLLLTVSLAALIKKI
tara:strand:- start:372 stop:755 length:384 start_codon:yes stop_codon:yes gene_type:complete